MSLKELQSCSSFHKNKNKNKNNSLEMSSYVRVCMDRFVARRIDQAYFSLGICLVVHM